MTTMIHHSDRTVITVLAIANGNALVRFADGFQTQMPLAYLRTFYDEVT